MPPAPIALARRNKIKTWLKAKGHNVAKINALKLRDEDGLRAELLALHGVEPEQYRMATGK